MLSANGWACAVSLQLPIRAERWTIMFFAFYSLQKLNERTAHSLVPLFLLLFIDKNATCVRLALREKRVRTSFFFVFVSPLSIRINQYR